MRILLAVDGSKPSLDAVDSLVSHAGWYREAPDVELVTVHLPVPKLPGVNKGQVQRYYDQEGEEALAVARKRLDRAKIPYRASVLVGPVAETVVKHAKSKRCDLIFIGTRGMSAIGNALLGSVATRVLQISDIPVLLVK
jgi:nucleotide-binding universal stress UspA family protein